MKNPDFKTVMAYDSGQLSAAERCADIANKYVHIVGENTAQKIVDEIVEEFDLKHHGVGIW